MLEIIVVAEPFLSASHLCGLQQRLNMIGCLSNEEFGGKLWIMWIQGVQVSVVEATNQFITITMTAHNKCICIYFVYAKCMQIERRKLWNSFSSGVVDSMP